MTEEELVACETIAAHAPTMGGPLTMCPGLVRQLVAEVRRLRGLLSEAESEVFQAALHSNPTYIGRHVLRARDVLDGSERNGKWWSDAAD